MLWKIQSGIAPPLFYVIVAEQEKLKTLRCFLSQTRNAVEPIAIEVVQSWKQLKITLIISIIIMQLLLKFIYM